MANTDGNVLDIITDPSENITKDQARVRRNPRDTGTVSAAGSQRRHMGPMGRLLTLRRCRNRAHLPAPHLETLIHRAGQVRMRNSKRAVQHRNSSAQPREAGRMDRAQTQGIQMPLKP